MAQAKKTTIEVVKTEEAVTLTLTLEEAKYLRALVGSFVVGCSPIRDLNTEIYYAFENAAVYGCLVGVTPHANGKLDMTDAVLH